MKSLKAGASWLLRTAKTSKRLRPLRVAFRGARSTYRKVFPLPRHPPIAELRRLNPRLPYGVVLEPTTACNAKCVFCPVSKRGADFEAVHLEEHVLDKLLAELKTWPATLEGYVQMVGLGEPTVARNFARNIRRLREAIPPKFKIALNTNGTTLHSAKVVSAIIDAVDNLTISINGHDEDSYKLLNGIPGFEGTLASTVAFLTQKNGNGYRIPATRVQVMKSTYRNGRSLKSFVNRIKPLLAEADVLHRQPLQTLAGVEEPINALQVEEDKKREALIKETPIPCLQIWHNAFITAEGDVYPCCVAGNVDGREARRATELCLGNLADSSLYELWNGAARKDLMRRHLDDEKPVFCKRCPIVTEYDLSYWRRLERHAQAIDEAGVPDPPQSEASKRRLPVVVSA